MTLQFVDKIPASTRGRTGGKWAQVAEQLREHPGKIALVAELPYENAGEKKTMTMRASGIRERLRVYGAKAQTRTIRDEQVIRVYAEAA